MVKFLHAADIHLDSPLKGLERYEGAPVEEIRGATRQALGNLVRLALDEKVDFVLIAGDLYDGDWRDHRTGLFFVSEVSKLREAGIRVCLIAGNHDAANRMTRSLCLPDNVLRFSTKRPETHSFDEFGVSVHGQGFATAACTDNLAEAYPAPVPGHFNIGLLHTAGEGSTAHSNYAQCCHDDLRGKQYDYWALGHIHQRDCVWGDPRIHFSGNIQGRHIRETGAKGCLVVTVDDRQQADLRFEPLDVLRWERCLVDARGAEHGYTVVEHVARGLGDLVAKSEGRPLAARVEISGGCRAHETLAADPQQWTNEVRAVVHSLGQGNVWIEKVLFRTSLPRDDRQLLADEVPLGELVEYIAEVIDNEALLAKLGEELADLARKLPVELKDLENVIRFDDPKGLRPLLEQVEPFLLSRLAGRISDVSA